MNIVESTKIILTDRSNINKSIEHLMDQLKDISKKQTSLDNCKF